MTDNALTRRQTLALLSSAAALRATPSTMDGSDPQRPAFHFLPPAHWMNDPNGPIYWKGVYHMFYQYNPNGATGADMHWGHATSPDMIHWQFQPPALAPTPNSADSAGCWTGTAFVENNRVHILYTGVRPSPESEATVKNGAHSLRESEILAVADNDALTSFTKLAPVIPDPPAGLAVNGFRDPSPWRQGDWWYTVLASGFANQGGAILLYRSRDLRHWEYLHPLLQREQGSQGPSEPFSLNDVWECPEFFPLGDRHVLISSTHDKVWWWSGRLDQAAMTFHPDQSGILDYGCYYAAKTQLDADGNRIIWGWIQETRPESQYVAAGWAGVLSLPRVLTLSPDGRLRLDFAPATRQLRKSPVSSGQIPNSRAELLLETSGQGAPVHLNISAGSASCLSITHDPSARHPLLVDGRPIPVSDSSRLSVHGYVDASVIELLINREVGLTKRIYLPANPAPDLQLQLSGPAQLKIFSVEPM